ncbi:MAG: NifU family protein [Planctomycetota bacterium]
MLELIRPMIQADGGDVELIAVGDDGVVQIRLLGACIGCPSAAITLQSGIERNLKAHIPSITAVKAID